MRRISVSELLVPPLGNSLKPVFLDWSLPIQTKHLLYTVCILSVLLYRSETWTPLQCDLRKLEEFHAQCLAPILGISRRARWQLHISNAALWQQWGKSTTITEMVMWCRFDWLGHVAQIWLLSLPLQVFFSWFSKKRSFCGPCRRWKEVICSNMRQVKAPVTPVLWFRLAQDRAEWYAMYKDAVIRDCCPELCSTSFSCMECHRECLSCTELKRCKCAAE